MDFGSIEIDQFAIWYQLMPMVYCESNWFIWKLNWRFMYKYGHTIITQPIFKWSMAESLNCLIPQRFCLFFLSISLLYNSLAACASGTHTDTHPHNETSNNFPYERFVMATHFYAMNKFILAIQNDLIGYFCLIIELIVYRLLLLLNNK